ncbi:F-box protein CPR1-like [Telopea speciosissima]|uniref:F-box protein CPR1-like n=1 Tax=Telopea speciosissima TaxID=54955 RepID=UPI001CC5E830|nr:F-box protein CPR1-like [Telopea speciosissima]
MADFNEKISEEEETIPTKNLPEGIIADILSRLPVKSLVRFKCVCKPWCALIIDPAFVKMHLSRSLASNSNLSLIFRGSYLYSVDLDACEQQPAVELDHPLKTPNYGTAVVGSCNGLLCIYNTEEDIFLWNPSTRRHQKLPITPIEFPRAFGICRFIVYGFGYDPTTDDYKLVRVVQFYGDDDYCCDSEVKVYTLSTKSWRRIGDMPFHLSYKHGHGVLTNFALHWVAKREMRPDTVSSFIVSFDLQDEEYREVPLPDFVDDKFHMNVGVLGGQLCLLCNFFMVRVEIWVMKDYGLRDSWTKQFLIEQPSVIRSFEYLKPVCYSKNGELILEKDLKGLVLYDPRRQRARDLRIIGIPDSIEIEICIGSLVPLNAKDGTEQAEKKKKNRKQKKKKNREQR